MVCLRAGHSNPRRVPITGRVPIRVREVSFAELLRCPRGYCGGVQVKLEELLGSPAV